MKKKALFIVAALALAACVAAPAQQVVTVTGTAAILNKDTAQARDRAIESALRAAVEQVIGTMLDSESLVKNNELLSDKIYTQTKGYISSYNIVSEKPDMDSNIYSVKVEAVVKQGNLQDDLNSLGVLMRRMKMPRVAVALNESGWTASSQLQKMLRDKGFLVVDTGERFHNEQFVREFWGMNETQQSDLMKQYGAEVVILGNASEGSAGSVGGQLASFRASVSFRALKTDTKELLGTASFQTNSVKSPEQATFECTNKAGRELMDQITSQWAKEAASSRQITLELTAGNASKANDLAKRLQAEGRGIQEVIVRQADASGATLNVSMQGDASDLAQEVKKLYPKAKIVSQTANRLTVSF